MSLCKPSPHFFVEREFRIFEAFRTEQNLVHKGVVRVIRTLDYKFFQWQLVICVLQKESTYPHVVFTIFLLKSSVMPNSDCSTLIQKISDDYFLATPRKLKLELFQQIFQQEIAKALKNQSVAILSSWK